MGKNILIFNVSELPDSYAGATRTVSLAKILIACGHKVELVGETYREGATLKGECEGIKYLNIRRTHFSGPKAVKERQNFKKKIQNMLKEKEGTIDAIILYGMYDDTINPFLSFSKKNGVPLIVDAVEWYNYKIEFLNPKHNLKVFQNRHTLKTTNVKIKNIIAISSLLSDYYIDRGCNTCVIPTIIDMDNYDGLVHNPQSKLQIAYAGVPGKKDYIINAIKAILLLDEKERAKLEMHLYGTIESEAKSLGLKEDEINRLKDCVFFHGRIPQGTVKDKVAEADFTILLRPNMRYANAGFPTKVGESMACGTPVIANITSDLGKYIIDAETGIICEDESVESCLAGIRKALALTDEEKARMRNSTLEMAKKSFDYNNYIVTIKDFLKNIIM